MHDPQPQPRHPRAAEPLVLFGGTFDPVHNGHLLVARAVAEHQGYHRVLLVPSAQAPHKAPAAAPAEHRLAMLRLAVEGEGLFHLCRAELDRPGPCYTIDTLAALRAAHGPHAQIHLILGADMLEDLPNWRRAEEVVQQARIVVAARSGLEDHATDLLARLSERFGPPTGRCLADAIVATPRIDISSTTIRHRVAEGKSIRYLVPDSVMDYVREHRLYLQG